MSARCVNESCRRPLHSFSEGRLFRFEIVSISLAASDENSAPFDEKPQLETVHFWLCGRCAETFTLVLEPARGLKLVPVEVEEVEESSSAGGRPVSGFGRPHAR
jgi:hypothetical protein